MGWEITFIKFRDRTLKSDGTFFNERGAGLLYRPVLLFPGRKETYCGLVAHERDLIKVFTRAILTILGHEADGQEMRESVVVAAMAKWNLLVKAGKDHYTSLHWWGNHGVEDGHNSSPDGWLLRSCLMTHAVCLFLHRRVGPGVYIYLHVGRVNMVV